jgi:hypothetical protein
MRRSVLSLLLVLATPAAVGAETTIYFIGQPVEVAPPLVLLVGGLALIGLGASIRKWFARARAPEPELPDGLPLGPAFGPVTPPMLVGSPLSDAEQTVPGSTDPSE